MKITIVNKHKSIPANISFELEDFSIITGLNGSGKTHLLEAISNSSLGRIYSEDKNLSVKTFIPFNGLNPQIGGSSDPSMLQRIIQDIWTHINNVSRN